MLADSEARRCFLFGTWRSAVAELFANRRWQQLAAGQPSDVLARCWILASAERDRSFESARKEGRVTHFVVVSSRARGRRLGQRIRSAAPARSYGDCSARADRNRWLRVAVITFGRNCNTQAGSGTRRNDCSVFLPTMT
jgi:hypothetical protein